jgi:hypothetical protein
VGNSATTDTNIGAVFAQLELFTVGLMTIDTPSITIASRSLALAWCLLSLITRHPSAKLVRIDVVIHSRARNLSFGFMPSAINSRRASLSNARQRLQFLASNERASKYLKSLSSLPECM